MKAVRNALGYIRTLQSRSLELRTADSFSISQECLLYQCHLNRKKSRNLIRQEINQPLLGLMEISHPHILHVGVTTRCNLQCVACPTGNGNLGRAGEDLDFNTYCNTIDILGDSLLFVLFWDWGEPFLHPRLPEMIAYAADKGARTVVSTNGNVPIPPERAEQIILSGIDTVIVCVDGADQETYESYRSGGSLESTIATIHKLSEARARLGQDSPLLEFRSLATKGNERQLPELLAMAQQSGADLFSVKNLRPYDYRGTNVDESLVPEDERLARYSYTGNHRRKVKRKGYISEGILTCGKPLYAPTLNSDGILAFCSYAQKDSELFGNLGEGTFRQVWKSRRSRNLRREFLKNKGSTACRTCFFRSSPEPTILHQVPLRKFPEGIEAENPETPEEFLKNFEGRLITAI